jgi:16S rRNA (guanine966-N2)-methyltransferase
MRIIGGAHRGRALASVGKGDVGAHLRPTSDRVRESLFNILANHVAFEGLRVLDLFAGTGALGFEALSRGAAHVTFVDDGGTARALLRENPAILTAGGAVKVFRRDARKLGDHKGAPFDLVFLDPPYGKGLGAGALEAAREGDWLAADALVVWEENALQPALAGFDLRDTRRYGDTHVTILRRAAG